MRNNINIEIFHINKKSYYIKEININNTMIKSRYINIKIKYYI